MVLTGIVGGAAKVRVQNWKRTASEGLRKCCMAMESVVAYCGSMAYDITELEDWESVCAVSSDGSGESLFGIGGAPKSCLDRLLRDTRIEEEAVEKLHRIARLEMGWTLLCWKQKDWEVCLGPRPN